MVDKVRENRLRRMAARQGLRIVKSRRRDPRSLDYGGYMIVDDRNLMVAGGTSPVLFNMDLDDIEEYLTGDDEQ